MKTFHVAPLPDSEEKRLATLANYALFDTCGEEIFDSLTRLAAQMCGTPISLIGLIDRDRQWFKASTGMDDLTETARDIALCAYTILDDGLLEIPDASLDARFADNPLVRGYPHLRFYAGVPLVVATGDALGTLCVIDSVPRTLSAEQRILLHSIAAVIVEQFERHRANARLFDRSAAELYEIDAASGRIVFMSESARRNTGYGSGDLDTIALDAVLPGLTARDGFDHFVTGLRSAGDPLPAVRTSVRRKDGTTYPIDLRLELLVTATIERVLALGVTADANAERNAVAASGGHVGLLTAVARELFDALDPRTLVDVLVRGISELTDGASAALMVRSLDGAFVQTRDLAVRPAVPIDDDAFLRAACASEAVLVNADGSRAAVQILASSGITAYVLDVRAASRLFDAADVSTFGLLGQYLAVAIRNVELYGELQSRRAAVTELNQVKNDLIAMLAHDFKGPLTTIVGLADVLAEDERFDAESRQFLGMINSSAMRLASLATDTLALSRLEQNELSLRFEAVDLIALIRDIVRVFSVTRGIDMRCSIEESSVRADPARLRQVFENLIGNAIKYSPRGDTVDVTLRGTRGGVEVAIRDRGIGIPAADIPKLFGRFARGSNARELGIGGTGFGLYLSRTIVERHGGQITVESKEGSGSIFRVFVPAVPAPQRTRDRRILLLDHEDDGRSFIAHTLRDEGYAVYPVTSETEFLRALDEGRYDAAIVDADRLAMSAVELTARIARRTKLVRLVSNAEPDTLGGSSALRKPFLIKDLKAVVETAVSDRRRGPRRGGPHQATRDAT
jgi:signal transduction histidine kinase